MTTKAIWLEKETVETLIEDLHDELVNRLDGTQRSSEIRIAYLKRAIKELKYPMKTDVEKWHNPEQLKLYKQFYDGFNVYATLKFINFTYTMENKFSRVL